MIYERVRPPRVRVGTRYLQWYSVLGTVGTNVRPKNTATPCLQGPESLSDLWYLVSGSSHIQRKRYRLPSSGPAGEEGMKRQRSDTYGVCQPQVSTVGDETDSP